MTAVSPLVLLVDDDPGDSWERGTIAYLAANSARS